MKKYALVLDLDNTLYCWMDAFAPGLDAQITYISKRVGMTKKNVRESFRNVFCKHGSVEIVDAANELDIWTETSLTNTEIEEIDVAKVLRESITEVLDPNLNGSVQAAQQRIDELAHSIDELIKLATVPETAESAMSDIARFSEEMKSLREFIETEKAKQMTAQKGSAELDAVLERLENENFTLTEYDDVAVRQLIEKVTVKSKNTIAVRFKGGFEVRKGLHGD